jgi:hypothetical protein
MSSFLAILIIEFYSDDQNKKNEMGEACGSHGGGNLRERNRWDD